MTTRILRGDVRERLADIESESVNCIVTSPPYWGLRSYLPTGHPLKHLEIGSEPTVEAWVAVMVEVMRACRRVLRKDGVMFLNLGDSYAGSRCGGAGWPGSTLNGAQPDHSRVAHQTFTESHREASAQAKREHRTRATTDSRRRDRVEIPRSDMRMPGLKPKDLVGQPWRLAFALQADGWWLRQEVIWNKPNPMPESTRDRFTKAHEHVFILTRSERYYWNFDAIQEEVNGGAHSRGPGNRRNVKLADSLEADRDGEHRTKSGLVAYADRKRAEKLVSGWDTSVGRGTGHRGKAGRYPNNGVGFGHGFDEAPKARVAGLNPKAALAVHHNSNTEQPDGAYAQGLSGRMGRAPGWREETGKQNPSYSEAISVGGGLVDTRNPRSVVTIDEDEYLQFLRWKAEQFVAPDVWTIPTHPFKGAHFATFPPELARRAILAGSPQGGTVLDPFFGAGTVGLVADRLGMHSIGIELDDRASNLAADRINAESPLLAQVEAAA